jgi:hypothetical protein
MSPQQCSRGTKKRTKKVSRTKKSLSEKCINSFLAHMLSLFGGGAYGSPPSGLISDYLLAGKKSLRTRISTTSSQPFNSSINSEIERRDDGNVLIA